MDILLDFALVPVITLIAFWVIEIIKQLTNNNESFKRFIPITATGIGVVLGLLIYFTLPSMAIADNWLFAIVVGGASGLAATGSNELIKQLKKSYTQPLPATNTPTEELTNAPKEDLPEEIQTDDTQADDK